MSKRSAAEAELSPAESTDSMDAFEQTLSLAKIQHRDKRQRTQGDIDKAIPVEGTKASLGKNILDTSAKVNYRLLFVIFLVVMVLCNFLGDAMIASYFNYDVWGRLFGASRALSDEQKQVTRIVMDFVAIFTRNQQEWVNQLLIDNDYFIPIYNNMFMYEEKQYYQSLKKLKLIIDKMPVPKEIYSMIASFAADGYEFNKHTNKLLYNPKFWGKDTFVSFFQMMGIEKELLSVFIDAPILKSIDSLILQSSSEFKQSISLAKSSNKYLIEKMEKNPKYFDMDSSTKKYVARRPVSKEQEKLANALFEYVKEHTLS